MFPNITCLQHGAWRQEARAPSGGYCKSLSKRCGTRVWDGRGRGNGEQGMNLRIVVVTDWIDRRWQERMTHWVLSREGSKSFTSRIWTLLLMWPKIIDDVLVGGGGCCFWKAHQTFWLTVPAGKCFLIIITLTGQEVFAVSELDGSRGRGELLDHSLERKVPGHHTLAKAKEPLGEFHFKNEK